jgi:hypothetical protein
MAFWDALEARRDPGPPGEARPAPPFAAKDNSQHGGGAPWAPFLQPEAQVPPTSTARTGSQLLDLLVDELHMTPAQVEKLEACRKVSLYITERGSGWRQTTMEVLLI